MDQMTSRPVQLQTLPPDGTVLEELIGAMQSEYGTPTTPQEYRLIIRTPVPEEQTDPSLDLTAATPTPQPPDEEAQASRQRPGRRRRRSRRRGTGSEEAGTDVPETYAEDDGEAEGSSPDAADLDHPAAKDHRAGN